MTRARVSRWTLTFAILIALDRFLAHGYRAFRSIYDRRILRTVNAERFRARAVYCIAIKRMATLPEMVDLTLSGYLHILGQARGGREEGQQIMAVLITGGAGYIGSLMVLDLVDAGESVVVIDNLSTGFRWAVHPNAELVVGDIGNQDLVRSVVRKHNVDAIIHFAGSIVVPESVADPLGYYNNNTVKSRSLMEVAVTTGVRNFIFSSTAAVYGNPKHNPVGEDAVPAPMSPYGSSKLMSEIMLADTANAHDLRYVALRYFNDDLDGDGYSIAQGDCDDCNDAVNPGAAELCGNDIDDNCDNIVDAGFTSPGGVIFSEDFDNISGPTAGGTGTYTFPAGWLLANVDNRTPAGSVAYVNQAWERRVDFTSMWQIPALSAPHGPLRLALQTTGCGPRS